MQLFFQKHGQGPALFILHGLYGSSDNWISVARKLAEKYTVYLVDQRNHGHSPHDASHTFISMVNDLIELIDREGLNKINLLGHSMGGKTAMLFGAMHPEKIHSLTVVDIAPDGYANTDGYSPQVISHLNIINAMLSLDLSKSTNRLEVEKQLSDSIADATTRQFIMKNLQRNHDHTFSWRLNINAISNALPEMMGPIAINTIDAFPVLFIKGERSGYLSEKHLLSVKEHFPLAKIITIPGAGHWVHADQPDLLVTVLSEFLSAVTSS